MCLSRIVKPRQIFSGSDMVLDRVACGHNVCMDRVIFSDFKDLDWIIDKLREEHFGVLLVEPI